MAFTFVSCSNEPAQAAGPEEKAAASKMMTLAKDATTDDTAIGNGTVTITETEGKITYDGYLKDGIAFSGVYEMKIEGTVATVHVDLKYGDDRLTLDAKGGFEDSKFSFDANATIRIDGKDYTLEAGSLIFFQIT